MSAKQKLIPQDPSPGINDFPNYLFSTSFFFPLFENMLSFSKNEPF